jgi:hypothetical protein
MCEYPNVCVPLWATIITPLLAFLIGLIPYFQINKKDKLQSSSDISKTINAQFGGYKTLLLKYIEQAKTQKDTVDFTELTNSFELLIGNLTDACEKLLNNALPKTANKKFLPIVKEICDYSVIQTYYGMTKMEYKKDNYQLIFDVYEKYYKKSS